MGKKRNPYRVLRDATGHSVIELARTVGVTRQRWYQLEGSQHSPSTTVLFSVWTHFKATLRHEGWTLEDLLRHSVEAYQ